MRFSTVLHGALAVVLLAGIVSAQCSSVTYSGASNGQKGAMFDIVNISNAPITVLSFDQTFLGGTPSPCVFEIYTHAGTFKGTETNAVAWGAPIGTNPSLAIPVTGTGTLVPTGIPLSFVIGPGATQAFWLTCTSATTSNIYYTSGPAGGLCGVMAADANLQLIRGVGKSYPLPGSTFGGAAACGGGTGRGWNGRVNYTASGFPSFETNSANSAIDFNGVQGGICSKAVTSVCGGSIVNINMNTALPGNLFEAAYNFAASVPFGAGAIPTLNGQLINLDLTAGVNYLMGGAVPALTPHPGVLSFGFGVPTGLVAALQQLVFDPSHLDGFSLSQASELQGVASVVVPGPVVDDGWVTLTLGAAPLCGPTSLNVYGTSYTQMHVVSNGRCMFGTPTWDWASTVAGAQTGSPFVGNWTDLSPNIAGTINIDLIGGTVVRVNYIAVNYYTPTFPVSFDIAFDSVNGNILLNGLLGIGNGGIETSFLGISMGAGATDPLPAAFSPAGAGVTTNATDMLYNFGISGTNAPGINAITLMPNAFNNYDFISL